MRTRKGCSKPAGKGVTDLRIPEGKKLATRGKWKRSRSGGYRSGPGGRLKKGNV